jgi:hypothetical protein
VAGGHGVAAVAEVDVVGRRAPVAGVAEITTTAVVEQDLRLRQGPEPGGAVGVEPAEEAVVEACRRHRPELLLHGFERGARRRFAGQGSGCVDAGQVEPGGGDGGEPADRGTEVEGGQGARSP